MSDHAVAGFRFAAGTAGLKESGKPDVALIAADEAVPAAGVFTSNRVVAPAVRVTRERVASGPIRAVLVNSGNANVCTGPAGLACTKDLTSKLADALGETSERIAMGSTGIIGRPLRAERIEAKLPELVGGLSPDAVPAAAEAIMTTDTAPKVATRTGDVGGRTVRVTGIAKGAGMIAPNMATMLSYLVTDAAAPAGVLKRLLTDALPTTFNAVTVDGDMSTSDTVLLLASGRAGGDPVAPDTDAERALGTLVRGVMEELAIAVCKDGEGATKFVTVRVTGAPSTEGARAIARRVAESLLVKTMFFGGLTNWGRVVCAAGAAGVDFDPDRMEVRFDEVVAVREGALVSDEADAAVAGVIGNPAFDVALDLRQGSGEAIYYTTDLSYEYVKINADYRT